MLLFYKLKRISLTNHSFWLIFNICRLSKFFTVLLVTILLCSGTLQTILSRYLIIDTCKMSPPSKFLECVFNNDGKSNKCSNKKGKFCEDLVTWPSLNQNIHQHSLNIGVNLFTYTERWLIMIRFGVKAICNENELICPYPRYSFTIHWRPCIS